MPQRSTRKFENRLKAVLVAHIKKYLGTRYEVIAHSDMRKHGVPDLSLSGCGSTTWWELKHGTPNFTSHGIQEFRCARLAATSFCRYVVYYDHDGGEETVIAHPQAVIGTRGLMRLIRPEVTLSGHDHAGVVEYMRRVHTSESRRP